MFHDLLVALDQRYHLRNKILLRVRNQRFWQVSGLLIIANLITAGLGLLRTPAMTWILPKDQIGMVGVVGSWLSLLQLLSLPGLDTASYHYVSKGQPSAFITNLIYRLRWSFLSIISLLVTGLFWMATDKSQLGWLFIVTGITFPITIGLTATAGTLSALENFKGLFWYRILESLVDFVGFIPLVLSLFWISQIITFYTANQVANAVLQVSVSVILIKQIQKVKTTSIEKKDEKEMVNYGKHLTVISGISLLQTRMDAFLVGTLLSFETMADYSIALLVSEQLKRIWGVYVTIRYPPLVKIPSNLRKKRFMVEGAVVLLGFIGIGILISLLSHWLVPVVLPLSYSQSLGIIDILITTFVISIPGVTAEIYFRTEQNEKYQYALRIVSAVIGIIAPALLIFRFGAYGAAFGRLIASIAMSIFGTWLFFQDKPL